MSNRKQNLTGENGETIRRRLETARKTYPLSKKATMAKEPEWTLKLEEWGANKEIEDLDYAHKKRSTLQQEIARREQKMRRHHRHQQQLAIILAWRDAARYLRENKEEIRYARHQIIDMGKPRRTYRASKGKQHTNLPIREYLGWSKGGTFSEKPIQIGKTCAAWKEYETMYTKRGEDEWR